MTKHDDTVTKVIDWTLVCLALFYMGYLTYLVFASCVSTHQHIQ